MFVPLIRSFPSPSRAVKITRNISGKANVKNADAGLRQKDLFV